MSLSKADSSNQLIINQYGITCQLTWYNEGNYCINTIFQFDPKTELGYLFIGNTGPSEANRSNHILIINTLVSFSDYVLPNNPNTTFSKKLSHRWYNAYSPVNGPF